MGPHQGKTFQQIQVQSEEAYLGRWKTRVFDLVKRKQVRMKSHFEPRGFIIVACKLKFKILCYNICDISISSATEIRITKEQFSINKNCTKTPTRPSSKTNTIEDQVHARHHEMSQDNVFYMLNVLAINQVRGKKSMICHVRNINTVLNLCSILFQMESQATKRKI